MSYLDEIHSRKGAKFSPRQWVEGELYDCVTFIASVYQSIGVVGEIEMPDYAVFGKGESMRDLTCQIIEETGGFYPVEDGTMQEGDCLVFSAGTRGHHTGIYLENDRVGHCVRGRGVVIDSYLPPISDHLYRVYRPI
jgi:cell wall-associated NlpC family hydrolase